MVVIVINFSGWGGIAQTDILLRFSQEILKKVQTQSHCPIFGILNKKFQQKFGGKVLFLLNEVWHGKVGYFKWNPFACEIVYWEKVKMAISYQKYFYIKRNQLDLNGMYYVRSN